MARKRRHLEDRSPNRAVADRPADSVPQEFADARRRFLQPMNNVLPDAAELLRRTLIYPLASWHLSNFFFVSACGDYPNLHSSIIRNSRIGLKVDTVEKPLQIFTAIHHGARPRCGAGFQPARRFVTAASPLQRASGPGPRGTPNRPQLTKLPHKAHSNRRQKAIVCPTLALLL